MKKLFFMIAALLSSQAAPANSLTVEFLGCTSNNQYVCAKVYWDNSTRTNFGGTEVGVDASEVVAAQIRQLIPQTGSSLALTINGDVWRVSGLDGPYMKLWVNDLNGTGPKPR